MLHVQLIAITKYLEDDGKPERLIARAGRVCYKSTKQGDLDKFIQARIRDRHHSILEHASLTFEISGISRACLAQLTRHRIASFSVESQRRVSAEDATFVIPPSIASNPSALKIFTDAMDASTTAYKLLRELGVKKEDSRFILPLATETHLVMTQNVRALRGFFETRLRGGSQWEIRLLAERMLEIAYRVIPSAFEDMYTVYVKGKEY